MYLSYEEYKDMGGTLDSASYPRFEKKSEMMLDYWTMDRLKEMTVFPDGVKEIMYEMIETFKVDGQEITSFSNDGISVSFADTSDEQRLYDMAVAYLPVELITAVV